MLRGHGKGVYGLIFLPGTDYDNTGGNKVGQSAGDILITGSADMTARSWHPNEPTPTPERVSRGLACGMLAPFSRALATAPGKDRNG